MDAIQPQTAAYAPTEIYATQSIGTGKPGIQAAVPQTTNVGAKEDSSKLHTVLKCLAVAAVAGIAIYGGVKAAKYLKSGHTVTELKDTVITGAKDFIDTAGTKIKNIGKKKVQTHTGEKLPLFNPEKIKPGRYADSAGNLVVVDKYGTSIIDFGQNRFLVNHGTTQKLYDGINNLTKNESVTGAVKNVVQQADLALIAPKALQTVQPLALPPASKELSALSASTSNAANGVIMLPGKVA